VSVFTDEMPEWLIGDKTYDSDLLDADLAEQQIEMIAPLFGRHCLCLRPLSRIAH
jgi:hypothetical protein